MRVTSVALVGDRPLEDVRVEAEAIARRCRIVLEIMWPLWRKAASIPAPVLGLSISEGCCIHASLLLEERLSTLLPDLSWSIAGGEPTARLPRGGYAMAPGDGYQHVWVHGAAHGLPGEPRLIVDVTADQFGGPVVLVAAHPDGRYLPNSPTARLDEFRMSERDLLDLLHPLFEATAHWPA